MDGRPSQEAGRGQPHPNPILLFWSELACPTQLLNGPGLSWVQVLFATRPANLTSTRSNAPCSTSICQSNCSHKHNPNPILLFRSGLTFLTRLISEGG